MKITVAILEAVLRHNMGVGAQSPTTQLVVRAMAEELLALRKAAQT